jgi:chromate reductase
MIGTARAQYHLRQVFVFLNMYPINQPEVMIAQAAEQVDAAGTLLDAHAQNLIRQLLRHLVGWSRLLQQGPGESA